MALGSGPPFPKQPHGFTDTSTLHTENPIHTSKTMGVSQVVFGLTGSIFGLKGIDIPNTGEFEPTVLPDEALLLNFTSRPVPGSCIRPKCRLDVNGQKSRCQLELHDDVEMQISGDFVATAVSLAPLPNYDQLPPDIRELLSYANRALSIEDKPNAVVLDLLSRHPFDYNSWRVQELKQDFLAEPLQVSKCQVQ
jgi:hypothetical protein